MWIVQVSLENSAKGRIIRYQQSKNVQDKASKLVSSVWRGDTLTIDLNSDIAQYT